MLICKSFRELQAHTANHFACSLNQRQGGERERVTEKKNFFHSKRRRRKKSLFSSPLSGLIHPTASLSLSATGRQMLMLQLDNLYIPYKKHWDPFYPPVKCHSPTSFNVPIYTLHALSKWMKSTYSLWSCPKAVKTKSGMYCNWLLLRRLFQKKKKRKEFFVLLLLLLF